MRCLPDSTRVNPWSSDEIKQIRQCSKSKQIEAAIRLLKCERQLYFASDYTRIKSPFALSLRLEVVTLLGYEGYEVQEKADKVEHAHSKLKGYTRGIWVQIKGLKKSQ